MPLHFLTPEATATPVGGVVTLTGAEAKHAATVRRVRVGESVTVGDGAGAWLEGVCESVSAASVAVRVSTRSQIAAPVPRVILVQALAKGDRDELAVQAATELGVDEIIPWQAARSISRWDATKAAKGRQRWQTIAREAAKQAHRPWVPEVSDPVTTTAVAGRARRDLVVVLEPTASERLSALAASDRDLLLVVGPEGGITPEELTLLHGAGATLRRLGDSVLRTSTAGPAAIALVSGALGRW
ncbi:16S rRNA (uracil(1498)-N(3))-methyltransferase [Microbacterium sp. ET2]|uniref:16S rRNA (uracil(1498)-N(3))-methyltransferase n=1 Tax=Microbacterium albipurpureum TaxID=3050384 RepID=UPI00259D1E56|nr:16S rRNA (uracil(1498)-N(3))-methyltransferase [Microbacterium sp. ET2 (Ac-2212)]WJL95672.1 16S rRNA (uracil(1498)-N(3))-methyltransferase [Microbacterium sp. ET2 (Ac-2212)]